MYVSALVLSFAQRDLTQGLQVVESFDQEQRRALLRFVTSCSRPPLLSVSIFEFSRAALIYVLRSGFKELVPNFAIRDAGNDEQRLPTASTCVNLLKVRYITSFVFFVDLSHILLF